MSRLPQHVRNLRNTLLARAGLSPSEDFLVNAIKAGVQRKLPVIFGANAGLCAAPVVDFSPPPLTWTIKSEIGQWIRRGIASHYRELAKYVLRPSVPIHPLTGSRYTTHKGSSGAMAVSSLTPAEFSTARGILESLGDLSILADVLDDAANSDDIVVLASAVDTLNYHFDSFSVIGAMN